MTDVHYLAIREHHPNYFDIVLDKPAINQYWFIWKYLSAEWNKSENKKKLRNTIGCLDKFSGSVYQLNRLVHHQKAFLSNLQNFIGSPAGEKKSVAFGLEEACYDFESLLLQARSCLDRITGYTMDLFGMKSKGKSFKRLRDIFQRNCPKRYDQNYLISLLDDSKWLEDFMISDKINTSLRDTVAHYSSFSEETQFCGNILKVGSEGIIATDLESYNIPLFETTWKITRYLPFMILNFLAYSSGLQTYPLENYTPRWKNWTVKASDFLENKNNQPLKPDHIMIAKRMHPTGFDIRTDNVLPSMYSKVITYCTELPRYVADKEKKGWELIGKTQTGFSILIS